MRPNSNVTPGKVHECYTCGTRVAGGMAGTCPACGGTLQHIGRSRDL